MNGRSGWPSQTARAVERQPINFEGLATVVGAVDDLTVTRIIACRCGGKSGRVVAGEGSSEGDWLDPLTWVCSACEAAHTFFDSSRDGYDGRFGHGSSYDQGTKLAEILVALGAASRRPGRS